MDDAGTLGRVDPADADDRGYTPAGGQASDWMSGSESQGEESILDQAEVDRLLGYHPRDAARVSGDIRDMADPAAVAYERLPALETVFERAVGLLSRGLREFFQGNVEVRLLGTSSVRLGDYLDSIPLPAQVAVFGAEGWAGGGLLTVSHGLAYATFDLLLGGRRGAGSARFDGRPFTALEMQLVRGLFEVALARVQEAFAPLSPVQLALERVERNPRLATVARASSAAVLLRIGIDMDGRGGELELVLPYASLEPIRPLLVQSTLGDGLGRDRVWEGHVATELWQAEVAVEAVLHEASVPLQKILALEVGSTLMFEARTNDLVSLRSGNWVLAQGRVGRMDDRIAVQVATPLSQPRTTLDVFHSPAPTAARRAESP
jgi:flagellar motor switch protein FliM